MRHIAGFVLAAVMLLAVSLAAQQQQYSGKVVNRDGVPQRGCKVEFYLGPTKTSKPVFLLYTDDRGVFYLKEKRAVSYTVKLSVGGKSMEQRLDVDTKGGLKPSTLVVNW